MKRIQIRNQAMIRSEGDFVLYWMQGAQRIVDNHALAFAAEQANRLNKPLCVLFVVMPNFPNANTRHFSFMLEGLKTLQVPFEQMGIRFEIQVGDPLKWLKVYGESASIIVTDQGYKAYEIEMRHHIAAYATCAFYEVDTNTVVPVKNAYTRAAYAAYAIRPSIMKQLFNDIEAVCIPDLKCILKHAIRESLKIDVVDDFINQHLSHLEVVSASKRFKGGYEEAYNRLLFFVQHHLINYESNASDPSLYGTSLLSPYLHFGQIAPVTILRMVLASNIHATSFIEQLVVRRELAYNYTTYTERFAESLLEILPTWAYETLKKHEHDVRPYIYTYEALENAQTHDPYWNAAQKELTLTGHMHNTMRMYWGKKVIEWTESPEQAFKFLINLNDKYQLDGRDPNGYAGIAWCFGKHDRPWIEREIFGKVRYMNAAGLKRKYNINAYVASVIALEKELAIE